MPGISNGPNSPPLNDTVAEPGPGIADDAAGDGHLAPEDLQAAEADRWAERLRQRGWTGACGHADDTEGHPS